MELFLVFEVPGEVKGKKFMGIGEGLIRGLKSGH
jgi:hypothetical protein